MIAPDVLNTFAMHQGHILKLIGLCNGRRAGWEIASKKASADVLSHSVISLDRRTPRASDSTVQSCMLFLAPLFAQCKLGA